MQAEAQRLAADMDSLGALAAKYFQTGPNGKVEPLRRSVAPADLAAIKVLIAASDKFVASFPANHPIWKFVRLQAGQSPDPSPRSARSPRPLQPARPVAITDLLATIDRCKQLHPEYRMAGIAALGRRLSQLIERSPERPFAEALGRLTHDDQEAFHLAVRRREWSDLYLSPLAQKVIQASRPGAAQPRATNVAEARRKRSAAYAARQSAMNRAQPAPNNRPSDR